MQIGFRKKRYYRGPWLSSKNALTGLLFVGLAFLHSCSFSSRKGHQTLEESLSGICLTGQGRGRLEHSKGRYLFSYESLLKKGEKKKWMLGLGLPLLGQEILSFTIPKKIEEHYRVGGSFARRLFQEVKVRSQRVLLSHFYQRLSELLWVLETREFSLAERKKGWHFSHLEGDFMAESPILKNYLFQFKASAYDAYFERLSLSLKFKGEEEDVLSLKLFLSSCDLL